MKLIPATVAALLFGLLLPSTSDAASPFGQTTFEGIQSPTEFQNLNSFSSGSLDPLTFSPDRFAFTNELSENERSEKRREENRSLVRGNCNDLSRLAIEPFRGRTFLHAFGEWGNCGTEGSRIFRARSRQ